MPTFPNPLTAFSNNNGCPFLPGQPLFSISIFYPYGRLGLPTVLLAGGAGAGAGTSMIGDDLRMIGAGAEELGDADGTLLGILAKGGVEDLGLFIGRDERWDEAVFVAGFEGDEALVRPGFVPGVPVGGLVGIGGGL